MSLIEELMENIVKHADHRYNHRREALRRELEDKGLKVYLAHELTLCKRKAELRQIYPKLELELMRKPPLLLGEIVQRGVKAYLPRDVEEKRIFHKVIGDTAIIDTPDFYSESRKSVYDVKFTRCKPKLLEHHRLRASMYERLSNAEHSYLLYCSPRGFKEFEINDEFNDKHVKSLMENWKSPMWDWEASSAYITRYAQIKVVLNEMSLRK
ncbi:MAG: hypothetical protein QXZ17_03665 [Nitrososphaerota archaeon]